MAVTGIQQGESDRSISMSEDDHMAIVNTFKEAIGKINNLLAFY
jgi:hypothetical protein